MEKSVIRRFFVSMAFVFASAEGAAQDLPFVVPDPDIRIIVDNKQLRALIRSADGIMWGGEWHKGGMICSSPDLHLEIQGTDLWMRGWTNWLDANGGLHALILGTPKLFTNDNGCGAIGLAAGCRIQGCMNDALPGIMMLAGRCKFFGYDIWNEVIPMPSPISVASQFAMELPAGPQKIDGGEIRYEFGKFENGKWIPWITPFTRRISLLAVPRQIGGMALATNICMVGDDPRTCDDPICNMPKNTTRVQMRRDIDYWAIDLSAQPAVVRTVASESAAEAMIHEANPLEPGDFVGISISPRFLTGDADGSGLFQRMFPIRAYGFTIVDNRTVEFEFFLTSARVALGKMAGADAIQASLEITGAEAWLKDDPGKRVRIDRIGADAAASLPKFRPDPADASKAVLDMTLLQMRFGISTNVGDVKVCIENADVAAGFAKGLPVLARYAGPERLFPHCIDADIPDLVAAGPCPDGKQTRRFSLERPEKNPTMALDLTKAKSRLKNGRWMMSIPRQ